jgi:hypothetical protein
VRGDAWFPATSCIARADTMFNGNAAGMKPPTGSVNKMLLGSFVDKIDREALAEALLS